MIQTNFFGTDGIRGLYGQHPLTPSSLWTLGWAVGRWILDQSIDPNPWVLLGKDTRESSTEMENAMTGGLMCAGVRILSAGVAPTPAIAFLTRQCGASMGLMISASHNPFMYNGVKFFNALGEKLSIGQEQSISSAILNATAPTGASIIPPYDPDLWQDYVGFLQTIAPKLDSMRLVVDCAHGAYCTIAPRVLRACGASLVDVLGVSPDGKNINDHCGSVYPEKLAQSVLQHQADAGIAFDGDGDRVIMVNRHGQVQDGDQILACLAMAEKTNSDLGFSGKFHGVVGTVMSNLGLDYFLTQRGIPFLRSDVGDRWVAEKMKAHQWSLGGEPCGHIVMGHFLPTGDGLLAGLHVLQQMAHHRALFPIFQPTPSITRNIPLRIPHFSKHPAFLDYCQNLQSATNAEQRILLRTSGTEPVLRLLVEGPNQEHIAYLAHTIENAVDAQQRTLENHPHGYI